MSNNIPYSEQAFKKAASEVDNFQSRPSDSELLQIYGLYKQHNSGDLDEKEVSHPGVFDLKGKAKYKAWEKLAGTSKETAGQKYITLVEELKGKYGLKA